MRSIACAPWCAKSAATASRLPPPSSAPPAPTGGWRATTPPGIPARCCSACPAALSTCAPATLLPPDPKHMINMSTASRLAAPDTPRPLWLNFLNEATRGDEELQRFLQQRAGYWLTGDTSREDFDFLYGPGGNGKGVFLKTITSIMGAYAATAPIGMFLAAKHEQHPTDWRGWPMRAWWSLPKPRKAAPGPPPRSRR